MDELVAASNDIENTRKNTNETDNIWNNKNTSEADNIWNNKNTNETDNIWEILPGEPPDAYARFCVFRDMGGNRSLKDAYDRFEGKLEDVVEEAYQGSGFEDVDHQRAYLSRKMRLDLPQTIKRAAWSEWRMWAVRWNWWRRALAWDREQERREQAIWEAARRELREKEWQIAGKLLGKAEEILRWPLSEEKTQRDEVVEAEIVDEEGNTLLDENGETLKARVKVARTVVVKPSKWTLDTAAKIADTASKVARLALDLNTQSIRVENWREEARMSGVNPDEFVERVANAFLNTMVNAKLADGEVVDVDTGEKRLDRIGDGRSLENSEGESG